MQNKLFYNPVGLKDANILEDKSSIFKQVHLFINEMWQHNKFKLKAKD